MQPGSDEFQRIRQIIGIRIRELRVARGLSQERLADLAGCDRTYVGMLERKQGNPSLRVLGRIAEALEVPVDALFAPGPAQSS